MGPEKGYSRALLKLSGGAFSAESGKPFDDQAIRYIVDELVEGHRVCPELAVVVGGGNILRGAHFRPGGIGRISADYAGMIATVVNALVLCDALEQSGAESRVYSAIPVLPLAPAFDPAACRADLAARRIVLLAGGTGNPLFTTDSAAALRGIQLGAQVLLKATRVDGVYSGDPEKDRTARLYERVTYAEVLEKRFGVMDLGAISLCMEHDLPVQVFNYRTPGHVRRALAGEVIGTLIGTHDHGR